MLLTLFICWVPAKRSRDSLSSLSTASRWSWSGHWTTETLDSPNRVVLLIGHLTSIASHVANLHCVLHSTDSNLNYQLLLIKFWTSGRSKDGIIYSRFFSRLFISMKLNIFCHFFSIEFLNRPLDARRCRSRNENIWQKQIKRKVELMYRIKARFFCLFLLFIINVVDTTINLN